MPASLISQQERGWKECNFPCRGQIVFNMIKVGEMSKTDEDKIEDFSVGYDFYEAFERPYLPKSKGGL